MNNMTAVEWLINEHFGGIENCTPYFKYHIEQAKKMEEDEKQKSYWHGHEVGYKKARELWETARKVSQARPRLK